MPSILVEAIASQMLSAPDGDKLPGQLTRALASAPGNAYRGGRAALLSELHSHLAALHAAAGDEAQRVRLVAAMCVVQEQIGG